MSLKVIKKYGSIHKFSSSVKLKKYGVPSGGPIDPFTPELVRAALWRALSAQPQDILRDAEKIQALESSVLSLRAQAQKNQLAIKDLTGQLEKAQSTPHANATSSGRSTSYVNTEKKS